jgi:hypothetical protein
MRHMFVMAVVCLAGCSPLWDYSSRSPTDEEADFVRTVASYKKLAAERVSTLTYAGGLQSPSISPLRKSHSVAFADWMACVQGEGEGQLRMLAIFYRDQKVSDFRLAVVIDRCEGEPFELLPAAASRDAGSAAPGSAAPGSAAPGSVVQGSAASGSQVGLSSPR